MQQRRVDNSSRIEVSLLGLTVSDNPSTRWARGSAVRKMSLQFVERPAPALLVAAARLLVMQPRMGESQQGTFRNRAKFDLDERLAGVRATVYPSPTHRESFGPFDREIFAAAFMLAAVEQTEADPEASADTRIGLGHQHGAGVRTPPARDTLRGGECIEDNRRPRSDPAHESEAGHRPRPFVWGSWLSA